MWLNCAQMVLGEQNCKKMSVLAHAVMRCPFQLTNRAVWKMEGAGNCCILAVIHWHGHWWCNESCNGDFGMVNVRMDADHDGDAIDHIT